jgi:F-type H+-transporting ATPase subunit beta
MANIGKIKQIIGPVVDVSFEAEGSVLPQIMNALEITKENGQKIILEVQQHLGEDGVRTVAMDATDGLRRGMNVVDLGQPITMPVGESIKGRLFNVIGEAIDGISIPLAKKAVTQFTECHLHTKIYRLMQTFFSPELKLSTC